MTATVCIAAAGNIINNICNFRFDSINLPKKVSIVNKVTEKNANHLFIIFNSIGVGLGFYISHQIGKPEFSSFFIIASALLYLYATFIKSILIIGNVIISGLIAFSIIIVGLFDLVPAITILNQQNQSFFFGILLNYAFFIFYMNLIREIIKDIKDIDADKNGNLCTLPIVLGRKRVSFIAFLMSVLAMFGSVYYTYIHLYNFTIAIVFSLVFVLALGIVFLYPV